MRPDLGAFFKNADGQFAARVIGKLFQPDRGGKAGRAAADNDHIIWHRFTFRHSNPPSPFRTNCRAHPPFRQRRQIMGLTTTTLMSSVHNDGERGCKMVAPRSAGCAYLADGDRKSTRLNS